MKDRIVLRYLLIESEAVSEIRRESELKGRLLLQKVTCGSEETNEFCLAFMASGGGINCKVVVIGKVRILRQYIQRRRQGEPTVQFELTTHEPSHGDWSATWAGSLQNNNYWGVFNLNLIYCIRRCSSCCRRE